MRSRVRTRLRILSGAPLAIGLIILSSGCGSIADGDSQDRGGAQEATSYSTVDSLPLGGFTKAEASSRGFIAQAEQRSLASCMTKQGFDYRELPPPVPDDQETARVGLANARAAATVGYVRQVVDEANAQPEEKDFVPTNPTQRASYLNALMGGQAGVGVAAGTKAKLQDKYGMEPAAMPESLAGGCQAQMRDEVYGNTAAYVEYWSIRSSIEKVGVEAAQAVEASKKKQELDRAWAKCMANQDYRGADNPVEFAVKQWPSPRPGGDEINAAIADIGCKDDLSYVTSVLTLHGREQERSLDGKLGAIERYSTLRKEVEDTARNVLES